MTETIITVAISTLVGLVFGFFFTRWNREYLTKAHCEGCKKEYREDGENLVEFKREMRDSMGLIKGLLLVLASGGKVSIDELKNLMK